MATLVVVFWMTLLLGQLGALRLAEEVNLYLQDIVLVIILLVAAVRYRLAKTFVTSRLVRPILLFAAVGAVSLLVNLREYPLVVTAKGSLYLLRWIAYAGFYGVVRATSLSGTFWFQWLGSFGLALSVVGLLQFVLYPDLRNLWYLGWDPHYYRVFATLLDPNYVGMLLVLAIFALWFLRRRFVVVIALIALLLTYSRSSYLALVAGITIACVLRKRWKQWLFGILFVLLIVVWFPKPGGETLSLDRYDSTVSRLQNWGQSVARIGERPVFGFGWVAGKGVDSSLLFAGVTTGFVGLASYLWLLVEMVRLGLRSKDLTLKALFLSSLGAIFVHSLFVNSLFYPWVMVWLWTLVGIAEKAQRV